MNEKGAVVRYDDLMCGILLRVGSCLIVGLITEQCRMLYQIDADSQNGNVVCICCVGVLGCGMYGYLVWVIWADIVQSAIYG